MQTDNRRHRTLRQIRPGSLLCSTQPTGLRRTSKVLHGLVNHYLSASSTDDKLVAFFSYFFQKTGFDISRTLPLMEKNCMKCQNIISEKKKKKKKKIRKLVNMSSAETFTQHAKR